MENRRCFRKPADERFARQYLTRLVLQACSSYLPALCYSARVSSSSSLLFPRMLVLVIYLCDPNDGCCSLLASSGCLRPSQAE